MFKCTCAGDLLKRILQKANAKGSKTWISYCPLPPIPLRPCSVDAECCLLDPHLGCNPRGSSRNSWFMRVICNRQAIPTVLGMCDSGIGVVEELCEEGKCGSVKC